MSASTAACDTSTVGFTTTSATVSDPGIEFFMSGATRSVDFADNRVTVTYTNFGSSPSPDLMVFSGLPANLSAVTLASATNPLDITTAFAGNVLGLLVNNPHCCTSSSASVSFDLSFAAPVPEPGTPALALAGLVALGAWVRRRAPSVAKPDRP